MDDRPIMFSPLLAKRLRSCEKAIVLQQIHWLSKQPRSGIEHNGHHWVWGTYQEWCEEHFSMWQPDTLRKHIHGLEKDGYLISAQLKSSEYDRTKHYRINYDFLASNRPHPVASSEPYVVGSDRPDVVVCIGTETSSEMSTENLPSPTPTGPSLTNEETAKTPPPVPLRPPLVDGLTAGELATKRGKAMKNCQDYDWRIHRDIYEATVDAMGKRALVDADNDKTIGDLQQAAVTLTKAGVTADKVKARAGEWQASYFGQRNGGVQQFIDFMATAPVKQNGNGNGNGASMSRKVREL